MYVKICHWRRKKYINKFKELFFFFFFMKKQTFVCNRHVGGNRFNPVICFFTNRPLCSVVSQFTEGIPRDIIAQIRNNLPIFFVGAMVETEIKNFVFTLEFVAWLFVEGLRREENIFSTVVGIFGGINKGDNNCTANYKKKMKKKKQNFVT